MLIDEPLLIANSGKTIKHCDKTYSFPDVEVLQRGVYLAEFKPGLQRNRYHHYPVLGNIKTFGEFSCGDFSSYGVCDSVPNLLEACPELETNDRQFVVIMVLIEKSKQPSEGGWRWENCGTYIGNQNSLCDYLYDEPEIESVFCYHIYEKICEKADTLS